MMLADAAAIPGLSFVSLMLMFAALVIGALANGVFGFHLSPGMNKLASIALIALGLALLVTAVYMYFEAPRI